ncbi:BlaR1 family beta-lactam sensor/signal transducer [Bariatricus sp. SGI.154]|uniref:BlaR1 family beta-lactam sensor/signal transducer n=1 Tax=Bariatricus sp. SGI.154 TaxID=3420549 RepID=UPI003D09390A
MVQFFIHFLYCNILIALFICMILVVKRVLKNHLSGRIQYNLWYLPLFLLAVPFIPLHLPELAQLISWVGKITYWKAYSSDSFIATEQTVNIAPQTTAANWMNDFAISVSGRTPSILGYLLLTIWCGGMLIMLLLTLRSLMQFHRISQSALPLQSEDVRNLFESCCLEMEITKDIPIYSTAFIKTPIMTGIFKPRIYLPIHLISDLGTDYQKKDLRYMLLHELQHYKHHDSLANAITNLAGIIYWFNPLIWYAIKEMRNDREIACDSSVLAMLDECDHIDYGNTLIHFAETLSRSPFHFASGLGGDMKQMKRRILNIASYQPLTFSKRMKGLIVYCLIIVLLLGFLPFLSANASSSDTSKFRPDSGTVSSLDLDSYFKGYQGSFVLYDSAADHWQLYNEVMATKRISPDSTYKIYDALLGLESGIITPEHSKIEWNGTSYPFDAWNTDQTLDSAMKNSANWYFQTIDQQAGALAVQEFFKDINYGNRDTSGELSSYWMESSLKISPAEQVELLKGLYNNELGFRQDHIDAVKDALYLSSSADASLYGKTGTGMVDGKNVNGWFVGLVESNEHTCFFAVNIQADENATGKNAADIALSVLSDLGMWQEKEISYVIR